MTSEGKFSIDFTLKQEGVYEIGLIFSKKSLTDRRLIYTVSRNWSAADTLKQLKKEAVKPGYATLVQKIAGYEGKVMGYNAYFLSAAESGDGWAGPYGAHQEKRQLFRYHSGHLARKNQAIRKASVSQCTAPAPACLWDQRTARPKKATPVLTC